MKIKLHKWISATLLILLLFTLTAVSAMAETNNQDKTKEIYIECSEPGIFTETLEKLKENVPYVLWVSGVCTEPIEIRQLENLTINNLSVRWAADSAVVSVIDSKNIDFNNLTVDGIGGESVPSYGVFYGGSDGSWINGFNIQNVVTGIAGLAHSFHLVFTNGVMNRIGCGVWFNENSTLIIDGVSMNGTNPETGERAWFSGLQAWNKTRMIVYGPTEIEGFNNGVNAVNSDILILGGSDDAGAVRIENNNNGAVSTSAGYLGLGGKTFITGNGSLTGGNSNGIRVEANSTLSISQGLEVTGNTGNGVVVTKSSHASINGAIIENNSLNGIAASFSSIVDLNWPTSTVSGNNTYNIFCSPSSYVNAPGFFFPLPSPETIKCTNLNAPEESIPLVVDQ